MILLLAAAVAIQAGAPDSLVYILSPRSRLEVQVRRAGVLGFLGHDHLIRARAVAGRAVYDRTAPGRSYVEVVVRADSLEVLTPPDSGERRQVAAVMGRDVLATARYPEIAFRSREITPTNGGFQVRGDLTIVGVTRDLSVDLRVTVGADTLRAAGSFVVRQTDYGIQPVRAGGGAVRVADRVTVGVEIVAVRQPRD